MYNLREIAQNIKIKQNFAVYEEELLKNRTSFKIGGKASLLIEPLDLEGLEEIVKLAVEEEIPYFVLGGGTNVVFKDEGFHGLIIATRKLSGFELVPLTDGPEVPGKQYIIRCPAGTAISAASSFAAREALTGLESFAGLPGTVGGAAYMNARCFDKELSDVAAKIRFIEINGRATSTSEVLFDKAEWAYKKSPFTGTSRIVESVELKVSRGEDKEAILARCQEIMDSRMAKGHFKYPCAGSVFKNNHEFGSPTGQIIDSLGLKGFSLGGAQIAEFHGNIIVNKNNATCNDVRSLCDYIIEEVKQKKGFVLEPEIIFVE